MNINLYFAGAENYVSKAGKKCAAVFVHPMRPDGSHELLQMKAACFDEALIEKINKLVPGTDVVFDLQVKDPIIRGVGEETFEIFKK